MFKSLECIQLQPKEGEREIRYLDKEKAKMCLTLKDLMENSVDTKAAVPLPLSVKVLDKIIVWIEYHYNDCDLSEDEEEYEPLMTIKEDISSWDKKYFDIEREFLFDLLVAANYLDIKGILSVGCKVTAQQLKGKSAEEVRNLWEIECDLDPEEEQRIKTENAWTERYFSLFLYSFNYLFISHGIQFIHSFLNLYLKNWYIEQGFIKN